MVRPLDRRAFLQAGAGAGVASLTGCTVANEPGSDPPADEVQTEPGAPADYADRGGDYGMHQSIVPGAWDGWMLSTTST